MASTVFNTLTRNKDTFVPATPGTIGLYVCGPTVYDLSHIGHARVYVAFDVIQRYLRRRHQVTYVRNFTDIDDKIIKRANESGRTAQEVSEANIAAFHEDMALLGCAPPDIEPKVTEHVDDIISMIQALVDAGTAYPAGGDVYYAVERFAEYGKLSRRSLEDMEAGARVEVNTQKRHPMDFVLWKAAKPNEPQWSSPWGPGRPGWHIECSAMAKRYLGQSFEMHGGGRDLIFPHHENEIAQSEAANKAPFSRVWLHGGLVNIDNEKMSKSLGNFFTIRQVAEKFDPLTLRYYLVATHYRSPINFSDAALGEAESRVRYFYETLLRLENRLNALDKTPDIEGDLRGNKTQDIVARFEKAMNDDFNTPDALGELSHTFKLVNDIVDRPSEEIADKRTLKHIRLALHEVGGVFGLFIHPPQDVLSRLESLAHKRRGVERSGIVALVAERDAARASKDFARSDALRVKLETMGVTVKDTAQGTQWSLN